MNEEKLTTKFNKVQGGLFQLEILEIFTTAFPLKTNIWTWIFSSTAEYSS